MLKIQSSIKLSATVTSLELKNNLLLIASTDKKLRIYDLECEKFTQELEGHTLGINQAI